MTSNPNDLTADIYDIYTKPSKGPKITEQELTLIKSLTFPGAQILDVGAGTGRHAVALANDGYQVIAIDSSAAMLNILQSKSPQIKTHAVSIFDFNSTEKYDVIILMWNVFNEIALDLESGATLLKKLQELLAPTGKILINIDDPATFNPASLEFITDHTENDQQFHLQWQVTDYDHKTHVTTSSEIITVKNSAGDTVRKNTNTIQQRWWTQSEITNLTKLTVTNYSLPDSVEFYLVLTRAS